MLRLEAEVGFSQFDSGSKTGSEAAVPPPILTLRRLSHRRHGSFLVKPQTGMTGRSGGAGPPSLPSMSKSNSRPRGVNHQLVTVSRNKQAEQETTVAQLVPPNKTREKKNSREAAAAEEEQGK